VAWPEAVIASFREVVGLDFEFGTTPGERPHPLCLVAHELRSGRRFRSWRDQFGTLPPYATGPDVLFVAYYASAELGCYRALGWPMPERILDLFTEFRDRTNGLQPPAGNGLLGALAYFGLDTMGTTSARSEGRLLSAIAKWRWNSLPALNCAMSMRPRARWSASGSRFKRSRRERVLIMGMAEQADLVRGIGQLGPTRPPTP
jgi:hypothetical protein